MIISVIIPTHNPSPERLRRTLLGLKAQTLPTTNWEALLVNNASTVFPGEAFFFEVSQGNLSIIPAPELGLTAARRCGLSAARGEFCIMVDDDNVLAPDYLAEVVSLFQTNPSIGAAGGKSLPEFAGSPPPWTQEFYSLLALRDLGKEPLLATTLRPPGSLRNEYPSFAPIGAGIALRRAAWDTWLRSVDTHAISDRRGAALTSGGDNMIVLEVMKAGWAVAYFPSLSLTHLIPETRLQPEYLARLNRGIQKSWMQVLSLYDANPWPPLSPAGGALRKIKAWFAHRAWCSPAARIRWQGACGHFDGRVRT